MHDVIGQTATYHFSPLSLGIFRPPPSFTCTTGRDFGRRAITPFSLLLDPLASIDLTNRNGESPSRAWPRGRERESKRERGRDRRGLSIRAGSALILGWNNETAARTASFICVSRYPNEKRQPPALSVSRLSMLTVTRLLVFFPPFSLPLSASHSLLPLSPARPPHPGVRSRHVRVRRPHTRHYAGSEAESAARCRRERRSPLNTNAARVALPRERGFNPLFDSAILGPRIKSARRSDLAACPHPRKHADDPPAGSVPPAPS